jgi:hypothetical protein
MFKVINKFKATNSVLSVAFSNATDKSHNKILVGSADYKV